MEFLSRRQRNHSANFMRQMCRGNDSIYSVIQSLAKHLLKPRCFLQALGILKKKQNNKNLNNF